MAGIVPDVVVIDYADIMADEGKDERASVNKRWKYLRGLADTHKCLIVTATQANSSSFDLSILFLLGCCCRLGNCNCPDTSLPGLTENWHEQIHYHRFPL